MGHILILLHKIVGFKLVVILLTLTMGAMIFQLSGPYKAHALNVHTEIRASSPGIVRIIDRTGEPPLGIVNSEGNGPTAPTTNPNATSGQPGKPDFTPPPGDDDPPPPDGNESTPPPVSNPPPPGIERIMGGGGGGGVAGSTSSISPIVTIINNIDFGTVFPGEDLDEEFTISITTDSVSYNITMSGNMTSHVTIYKKANEIDTETDNTTQGDNRAAGSLDYSAGDASDTWIVKLVVPDIVGDYGIDILIGWP